MSNFQIKNVIWKYPDVSDTSYDICSYTQLNSGLLITDTDVFNITANNFSFKFECGADKPLLYAINEKLNLSNLPLFDLDWQLYLNGTVESRFQSSVFPIIYSITTSFVISVFLTACLFTNHYMTAFKPTLLLKFSSIFATSILFAINIKVMVQVHDYSNDRGVLPFHLVIRSLINSDSLNAVYLIAFLLLLLTQVDIVNRMFLRPKEKRVIFISGIVITVLTQVLWALSNFMENSSHMSLGYFVNPENSNDNSTTAATSHYYSDDSIAILPAFVYLFRISLSVMYSSLIYVYGFSKRKFIFKSKILPLTVLTLISVNISITFFVVDISSTFVNELSEVFNLVCYMLSCIITWEWLNRIIQSEKNQQKQGVLGRQCYSNLVKKNGASEDDDDDVDILIDNNQMENNFNLKFRNFKKLNKLKKLRNIRKIRKINKDSTTGTSSNLGFTNDEVFIYKPKQVVIDEGLDSESQSESETDLELELEMELLSDSNAGLKSESLDSGYTRSGNKMPVIEHQLKIIKDDLPIDSESVNDMNEINLEDDVVHFEPGIDSDNEVNE